VRLPGFGYGDEECGNVVEVIRRVLELWKKAKCM
jgi:hypothetical protein